MSVPLITVALCVFNGTRYLREQMDSVLSQRDVALEVIAVDDGSTDDSVAMLREYAARDQRVSVHVNAENLGPRRSFERAMSLGHGDFLAPCDQDDLWHPSKLARLMACIGDHDLAYCDSEFVDGDGARSGRRVSDELSMMEGTEPLQFVFANSVSGHASLLRRELFERARPFPAGVFHDWWLAMCAAAGRGVVYLDEPLVQFRRHAGAFSTLGRKSETKAAERHRRWLDDRFSLLDALASRVLPDDADIALLRASLATALAGGSRGPLLRELWRARHAVEVVHGSSSVAGLRLQLRFLRKLRSARELLREPVSPRL